MINYYERPYTELELLHGYDDIADSVLGKAVISFANPYPLTVPGPDQTIPVPGPSQTTPTPFDLNFRPDGQQWVASQINDGGFWHGINPFDDVPWHPFGDTFKGINPFDDVPFTVGGLEIGSILPMFALLSLSNSKSSLSIIPMMMLLSGMNFNSTPAQSAFPGSDALI